MAINIVYHVPFVLFPLAQAAAAQAWLNVIAPGVFDLVGEDRSLAAAVALPDTATHVFGQGSVTPAQYAVIAAEISLHGGVHYPRGYWQSVDAGAPELVQPTDQGDVLAVYTPALTRYEPAGNPDL